MAVSQQKSKTFKICISSDSEIKTQDFFSREIRKYTDLTTTIFTEAWFIAMKN